MQRYQSLPAQVADRIVAEMSKGSWGEWLPSERMLTKTLQVSRKTLRKALAHLQHTGAIRTQRGRGHQIAAAPAVDPPAFEHIGLLTPQSLENLRPYTALWVDELRALLFEEGLRLTTFSGPRYFSGRPEKALARLVDQNLQRCWILAHSNETIQRWFHDRRIPCIIAGSCHPGLPLPNIDLDYFAICRHAVGTMLRHGHRRLAMLTKQSNRAGDLESERGFNDGVSRSTHPGLEANVVRHDGSVAHATRMLARLFSVGSAPTALLVANSAYYLTTIAFLAERGLRVPRDVSLVCRDDDTFLNYLTPLPARYSCNPMVYAKQLRLHLPLSPATPGGAHTLVRIEPKFISGGSLGPPASVNQ